MRPLIAISSCLLGQQVRYDGGHKRNEWLLSAFAQHADYRPICPEVGIGMSIPRPPIQLVHTERGVRVLGVKDPAQDFTDALTDFGERSADTLRDISGYVLTAKSPSCGMERVKLYHNGRAEKKGVGAYAAVIMRRMPNLPVEEDGRLNDPVLRENFVNRVFVYTRWRQLLDQGLTAKGMIEFHAGHKYLVMAHSQAAYQRLGRMVAHLKGVDLAQLSENYEEELMTALKRRVSRKRHVNVLQHIMGYLKKSIDSDDKGEMLASIEAYRRGEVPLVVPVTLLRHHFRRYPDPYMEQQWYLKPYPDDLGLRNQL